MNAFQIQRPGNQPPSGFGPQPVPRGGAALRAMAHGPHTSLRVGQIDVLTAPSQAPPHAHLHPPPGAVPHHRMGRYRHTSQEVSAWEINFEFFC